MRTAQHHWWRQIYAVALVLGILGFALTCGITSARWIGSPFPGFFVMANQVVASVSLPHWPVAHSSYIYQHAVVAVNDEPVATSQALYAFVRRFPAGSPFTYTLEKDGQTSPITVPSLTFTLGDYFLLFVAYLFNGVAIALIGIGVWFLKPATPASRALFVVGLAAGLFALTGADLYFPHWFFRLHVLSEAVFPAGLIHLALVFPIDRLRHHRSVFVAALYLATGILGVVYELLLYQPAAYSFIHNLCIFYLGTAGLILLGKGIWDYSTTNSHLIRRRIRVVLLGFIGGFAFPAILNLFSGITGGEVAVNYAAFTAFVFPLSLGYAIVKHDLFEIDTLLKRGVYYLTLTAVLTLSYMAFLALLNFTLRSTEFAHSPIFPLLFTLAIVLFLNPLKDYLQTGVDRIFFRLRYNPQKVLEGTSASLASTLHFDEILPLIWHTISETLGVQRGGILLLAPDKTHYVPVYPKTRDGLPLPAIHPLISTVRQRARGFSVYDLASEDASLANQEESQKWLDHLGAQLIVPLIFKGDLIGLIVLGNKESGAFFSVNDMDFLSTLANQSALSISNALAYQEIQEFNVALEAKVEERTQALAQANTELHTSLRQLEQTYRDLQRSQENLVQAEKMAALGRLTAGIAHEMNTPLGASLSSLKLLWELVEEYRRSIGDREVTESDHEEIAAEMNKLVRATQQWTEKAAAHIRSLKLHTRDLKRGKEQDFSVLQVIEDTRLLLSHRFRLSQCTFTVSSASANPMLHGDPGKFGQVLTNLIVNAIDAYKDMDGGEIYLVVAEGRDCLEIRVIDHGCGIAAENIGKIFDELFSTKPLGEGTGLGLPIARDIVTNFFDGTISVESAPGHGSVFILRLPRTTGEADQGKGMTAHV